MKACTTWTTRLGIAACAAGMSLLGPQSVGPAWADDADLGGRSAATEKAEESTPASKPTRAPRQTARASTTSQTAQTRPRAAATRRAADLPPKEAETDATPTPAPFDPVTESQASGFAISPTAEAPKAAAVVPVTPTADNASANTTPVTTPVASSKIAQLHTAPAQVALPQVLTTLRTRVVEFLDNAINWLTGRPTTPVTYYLSGALYLVRRSLVPGCGDQAGPSASTGQGGSVGCGPSAPFSTRGATKATVTNATNEDFDIYAYADGDKLKDKFFITTLKPGQSWSNTASNSALAFDHNLEIYTEGGPRMRIVFNNPAVGYPYIGVLYAPRWNSPPDTKNRRRAFNLSTGENGTFSDSEVGNGLEDGSLEILTYRGNDIDSRPANWPWWASWNVGNTKDLVATIKEVPTALYNKGLDGSDKWVQV